MSKRIIGAAGLALACVAFLGNGVASASTGWRIQPTPNPSRNAQLNGVSCSGLNACTAVGVSSGGKTLAEHGTVSGGRCSRPRPRPALARICSRWHARGRPTASRSDRPTRA